MEGHHAESRTAPKTTSTGRVEEPKAAALAQSQERLEAPKTRIGFAEVELEKERERGDRRPQNLEKETQQDPTVRIPTGTSSEGEPSSTLTRHYREGRMYKERAASSSYFDEGYRYREEDPRTTSRKYDSYERERRPDIVQPEKERKSTKWPEKAANDLPFNIALKFKTKAERARETVKEKTREKETHASSAKARDRDQRRERMDKQSTRRSHVEDDNNSSDSDTDTYVSVNRPPPRTSKSSYSYPPRTNLRPIPTRRKTLRRDEEDEEEKEEDKWLRKDESARDYIERFQRPGLAARANCWEPTSRREKEDDKEVEDKWQGAGESAREYIERHQTPGLAARARFSRLYWESDDWLEQGEKVEGEKVVGDIYKRPRSSKVTRPSIDVPRTRPFL